MSFIDPLTGRALIVVDVQNDFCHPQGSLYVAGADGVAKNIANFLDTFEKTYRTIIFSKDWHHGHDDNGGHFSETPDFVDTWPRHCVSNDWGSETYEPLKNFKNILTIRKGSGKPAYSAFEGNLDGVHLSLEQFLDCINIKFVDVVGVAYDYCVESTAMDSQHCGFDTTVYKNLTASVNTANDITTTQSLLSSDVHVVDLNCQEQ